MIRVYLSGDPVHDRVLRAFAEGSGGKLVESWKYEPSPVAVIFGVRKSQVPKSWPRGEIFRQQRDKNLDVVVLETGYINRGDGESHHYAAGFNGLNGRADFRNEGMPDDRAIKLRRANLLRVLNYRQKGSHVVLCGQVPWDASLEGSDHWSWLQASVERLRAYTDRKIVFKPHPKALGALPPLHGCELSVRPLAEEIAEAHAVVTFNSNSGVEALIDGVPVFASDQGSMCWELANKSLLAIDVPNLPDREQWINDLCYTQWTLDEMRSGETWNHLSR